MMTDTVERFLEVVDEIMIMKERPLMFQARFYQQVKKVKVVP